MTMISEGTVVIGLAEISISRNPATILTCLGLGSCIGMALFDPVAGLGGMAHIVLPNSDGKVDEVPSKYADTAVPLLVERMEQQGGRKSRMIAKMAGGAQMSVSAGAGSLFKTGEWNIENCRNALNALSIRLAAEEVGGHNGRTLRLYVGTGKVTVSSFASGTIEL